MEFLPSKLSGQIMAPDSKSYGHRLLILAALGDKTTTINYRPPISMDLLTTIEVLKAMGAKIILRRNYLIVEPIREIPHSIKVNFAESGTSLRLLLPIIASLGIECRADGKGQLPNRPISELIALMGDHGVNFSNSRLPFTMSGKFTGSHWKIPGNISSQYISGLLLGSMLQDKRPQIELTTAPVSKSYIDLTIAIMESFGLKVENIENTYRVKGGIQSPKLISIEGDWSSAAFYLVAGAFQGPITITGLDLNSIQGDKKILKILKDFGAKIELKKDKITVSKDRFKGTSIDIDPTPDLFMPVCLLGAMANSKTIIYNIHRLKDKESNRINAMESVLRAFGINCTVEKNKFLIEASELKFGKTESFGDHRIAMAASILASVSGGIVEDVEVVEKSYPNFFIDYINLGGDIIE